MPDITPPSVVITQPPNGVTLTAPITIKADAVDNVGVAYVEFLVDGTTMGKDSTAPYEQFWNVGYWADGNLHTLLAKAADRAGNLGQSPLLMLTVSTAASTAPELVSPADSIRLLSDTVKFIWRRLPDAVLYALEVSSSPNFSTDEFSVMISDTAVIMTPVLNSSWHWRVRGKNALGLWGAWSRRTFYRGYTFTRIFGGSSDDGGSSVQQTVDGGFIIGGATSSIGAGYYDVYLIKTDIIGSLHWTKTFGGSNYDRGSSVQQTSDGGFVLTGETASFGAGGSDVYLIKTDANGNEQWTRTFGGSSDDRGSSVQQTTDGGYIIAGETSSFGAGGSDVYLIKTDANGNEQWIRGPSVHQTIGGGFIIAHNFFSFGAGGGDVYLIKTDANGNQQWARTFGGSSDDRGSSVQQTTDGGFIVAGTTYSFGAGLSDVYLVKTDVNGNIW